MAGGHFPDLDLIGDRRPVGVLPTGPALGVGGCGGSKGEADGDVV